MLIIIYFKIELFQEVYKTRHSLPSYSHRYSMEFGKQINYCMVHKSARVSQTTELVKLYDNAKIYVTLGGNSQLILALILRKFCGLKKIQLSKRTFSNCLRSHLFSSCMNFGFRLNNQSASSGCPSQILVVMGNRTSVKIKPLLLPWQRNSSNIPCRLR